jgi:hypothetical protein
MHGVQPSGAAASAGSSLGDASFAFTLGRAWIRWRVLAAQLHSPVEHTPIVLQVRAASRAAPFFRE